MPNETNAQAIQGRGEIELFAHHFNDLVNTGISRGIPITVIVGIIESTKHEMLYRKIQQYELESQKNQGQSGETGSTPPNTANDGPRLVH